MADTDAVRAHHRAALARRLQAAPPTVQRWLQARLPAADAALADAASSDAAPNALNGPSAPSSPAAPRKRRVAPARPPASPLAQLNLHIAAGVQPPGAVRPELRSAQAFRETWSRICAENDVHQAVQRAPENAGPLNSHRLVLRTLELMRGLSPDYLRRFMAHADTLLWLDQASSRLKAPAAAAPGKAKSARQKR